MIIGDHPLDGWCACIASSIGLFLTRCLISALSAIPFLVPVLNSILELELWAGVVDRSLVFRMLSVQ